MMKQKMKLWFAVAALTLGMSITALADEVPAEYQTIWQQLDAQLKSEGYEGNLKYNSQLVADYEAFKNGENVGDQRYISSYYSINATTGEGSWRLHDWFASIGADSAAIMPYSELINVSGHDQYVLLTTFEDTDTDGTYWRMEETAKTWEPNYPFPESRQWPIYAGGKGAYYYENNQPVTGWRQLPPKNGWFYFENGLLKIRTFDVDGKSYYVIPPHGCAMNQWVDNHYYGPDGALMLGGISHDGYIVNADGTFGGPATPNEYSEYRITEETQALLDTINQLRAEKGVAPLIWSNNVAAGASGKVEEREWAYNLEGFKRFAVDRPTPPSSFWIELGNQFYTEKTTSNYHERYSELNPSTIEVLTDDLWTMMGAFFYSDPNAIDCFVLAY